MLAMVGGSEAIQPMKEPFIEKMKQSIQEISQSEQFNNLLREELEQPDMIENLQAKVSNIIEKRLNELTPPISKRNCSSDDKKTSRLACGLGRCFWWCHWFNCGINK